MNIHEYLGAKLLKEAGIPVSQGDVAETYEDGKRIAESIGYPVVLKAQVLTGGRGKAGGVKLAKNEEEFKTYFEQIRGMDLKGYIVKKIFIVKAIDIKKEVYIAVTNNPAQGEITLIGSAAGGIDIEEVAEKTPEKIEKLGFSQTDTPSLQEFMTFASKIFETQADVEVAASVLKKMFEVYVAKDCSLLEVNPYVQTGDGQWIAADAKVNFDDNALFRQQEIATLRDPEMEDTDELTAKEQGLSFVKLDGDIGCIVNGAGLAMATMDIVKIMGGEPANFLDVGGSSNPQKMVDAIKLILGNEKTKGILINIFGGITRCDDIANGLLQALKEVQLNVPYVVRLTGTNETQAREILAKEGITCYSTMREAVGQIIEQTK